jgi:glycerol-3-phosphate acyltransferase PlsY
MGTTIPPPLGHDLFVSVIVLATFLGHLYPLFLKFKNGGKGVATAAGCFLAVSPPAFLAALLVFVTFIFWTNTISAGSLTAIGVLPVLIWFSTRSWVLTGCAVTIAILVYVRHRDNIHRLWSGTENVMRKKPPEG